MPRPSLTALRSSALVLGAALVAGCGGSGGTSRTQPSGPALDQLVQAGASSTASGGSARVTLTSETRTGGQDVVLVGEGAYDFAAEKGGLTFSLPVPGDASPTGATVEARRIGGDLYLSLPQPAGVFYRLPLADLATTSLAGASDPTAYVHALRQVSDVEEVGHDEVRGVPATRYRGELDVEQAVAAATGNAKRVLQTTLGAGDVDEVPFEAWLDDQGRLVKLVHELALPASPATGTRDVRSRSTLELYDFGAPVDVAVPSPASVLDGTPLLAALRG